MKKSRAITIILAILAMLFWGTLFPYIKIGYKAFKVDTSSTADILIFASIRFLICGLLLSVFCLLNRKRIGTPQKHDILQIAIMGFFAIFLHYAFTYIGLSVTDSSKTALLKQLGTLFYVSFAFLFVKEEEYSINKIVGVMVGFFGIVSINSGGGKVNFSYGDILIILASVCTVISSIMSKKSVKNESVLWVTGISQLFGGVLLLLIGIQMYIGNAKGFLHWGYNYYYGILSHGVFNPMINPCGYKQLAGASYIVYPDINGKAIPSLRMKVFYEAINDYRALQALEELVGRNKVIDFINKIAGRVDYKYSPTNEELFEIRQKINGEISKNIKSK